jgi:hypothetical protein
VWCPQNYRIHDGVPRIQEFKNSEFCPEFRIQNSRHVLNRATPAEVRAHVLERLRILSPGGGFVFNTVHNILPEVPPQNVVAMFEAVEEFNGA